MHLDTNQLHLVIADETCSCYDSVLRAVVYSPSVYPICTLFVPCLYPLCTLPVPSMCPVYA